MFSLLSGQEKAFDKTLCVLPRTYGGLNHIRFAELSKEVHKFSEGVDLVQILGIWLLQWLQPRNLSV